jgi:hypothetical protein
LTYFLPAYVHFLLLVHMNLSLDFHLRIHLPLLLLLWYLPTCRCRPKRCGPAPFHRVAGFNLVQLLRSCLPCRCGCCSVFALPSAARAFCPFVLLLLVVEGSGRHRASARSIRHPLRRRMALCRGGVARVGCGHNMHGGKHFIGWAAATVVGVLTDFQVGAKICTPHPDRDRLRAEYGIPVPGE